MNLNETSRQVALHFFSIGLIFCLLGCSRESFSSGPASIPLSTPATTSTQTPADPGSQPTPAQIVTPVAANILTEVFSANQTQQKVDILFVDDNSASMDVNEDNVRKRASPKGLPTGPRC